MKTAKKYDLLILITVMLFTYSINAQTWEEIGFNLPDGDTASYNTLITFTNKNTDGYSHTQTTLTSCLRVATGDKTGKR
jgi:hypothetical protein